MSGRYSAEQALELIFSDFQQEDLEDEEISEEEDGEEYNAQHDESSSDEERPCNLNKKPFHQRMAR